MYATWSARLYSFRSFAIEPHVQTSVQPFYSVVEGVLQITYQTLKQVSQLVLLLNQSCFTKNYVQHSNRT